MARKKTTLKRFNKRVFLNGDNGGSNAYVSTKVYGGTIGTNRYEDNYEIEMTDCNNKIILHGNLGSIERRKLTMQRLDNLINTITELKEDLINQFDNNGLKY